MIKLDWNEYLEKAVQVNTEGAVLLRNEGKALPLDRSREIALFGRVQLDYYKSGVGSGGLVNVDKVTNIADGLLEAGAKLNEELLSVYRKWVAENPYDPGEGWGSEPWSQKEMPLTDELVAKAAGTASAAVVVIGRTAGEEMDNSAKPGSYLLSEGEEQMLRAVRAGFDTMIVLLNVGNIIDMRFVDKYSPEAVMYIWQGGMTGGTGTARLLLGDVSPSGRLPDTIAYSLSDYPSDSCFGGKDSNIYYEDIYVGYRWFETFTPNKVRYPFGYGLSYTDFESRVESIERGRAEAYSGDTYRIRVTNMGERPGKEVVQLYCEYRDVPKGALGCPKRILCGFAKTGTLAPGESETVSIPVRYRDAAVYDDTGVTGHKNCWVLPADRRYVVCLGNNAAEVAAIGSFGFDRDIVIRRCTQALAPNVPFDRLVNSGGEPSREAVPTTETDEQLRRIKDLPEDIPYEGDKGILLGDVVHGKNTLEEFISQLTDDDLNCLVRGEGMCSPKVTPGTAAAFGGVSKRLQELGVPCGCCSDGPSGMRLDTGAKAFSLPIGTLIASTFNTGLITELFALTGQEMHANKVDCLLGPGMNIHRHPLNGRNFEYFSEDPFLTGAMAAAELKGLHSAGVEGTIKHFCGNNQETGRHTLDSIVSERALREIYLKGFRMAVEEGGCKSIMTTYGKVNGLWTAGSYDLNTVILRDQWDFKGFVMTDWWANINRRGCAPDKNDLAAMVMAQNDVYMVCPDGEHGSDNIAAALADGSLTRAELVRCAGNILGFLMTTHAMKRLLGEDEEIEIVGRTESSENEGEDIGVFTLEDELTIDLSSISTQRGKDVSFTLDLSNLGFYDMTMTASSAQSELAQMPVTVFRLGTPYGSFTWNGTGGKPVSFTIEKIPLFSRFTVMRLHFGLGGLDLISLKFKRSAGF